MIIIRCWWIINKNRENSFLLLPLSHSFFYAYVFFVHFSTSVLMTPQARTRRRKLRIKTKKDYTYSLKKCIKTENVKYKRKSGRTWRAFLLYLSHCFSSTYDSRGKNKEDENVKPKRDYTCLCRRFQLKEKM